MRLRVLSFAAICLLAGPPPTAAAEPNDGLPPAGAVKPELYATGFEFAEGPALDAEGNLYVVNYRGNGNIGRIAVDGTAGILCVLDKLLPVEGRKAQANGLKLDRQGRLIVADAGGGRLLRIAPDGAAGEILSERHEGKRYNAINDVALDLAGNIYFTDPGGSSAENPVGALYRYDAITKKVAQLGSELAFPNGLAVTPDQTKLCVAESKRNRILLYDLTPDGTIANRRVLIDLAVANGDGTASKHEPDGLIVDAAGRLYVAMWVGGVIAVVDVPSGKLLRQYEAGGARATNCHFHGDYLYTTVADKEAVFRLKLGVLGFDYNMPP
jgi:gluconolactonase